MNETKHTPTPYTVQRLNHADGETWIQIGFMDEGREIGPLAEMVGGAVRHEAPVWHPVAVFKYLVASDAEVLANAKFIVRACNSHDAMLRALREALPYMRSRGLPGGVYNPTLQQMVKAIAQAEGKE